MQSQIRNTIALCFIQIEHWHMHAYDMTSRIGWDYYRIIEVQYSLALVASTKQDPAQQLLLKCNLAQSTSSVPSGT